MSADVQLRMLPYPYRAILAICSDLDETPDRRVYWEIMQFLNTTETTAMGPGVGLEVGNSIYFDMPSEQFAYWNTDNYGREMVRTLIRSGHIDCLHSYGDLAATREQAARALDELNRHNCQLEVWVDHGTAPTNFGSDIMQGHGDEPDHPAYHADLTTDYGIKYVWRGRVTSITGQDVSPSLGGIFNCEHPAASGQTLLKEAIKQKLAHFSNKKYLMHRFNQTFNTSTLRDGSQVYEFLRCNPHWGGVSCCDQGRYIEEVLTNEFMKRLVKRGGACILYTHLGKIDNPEVPFNQGAIKAFHRLAQVYQKGDILVTTTRRLLGYFKAVREVTFNRSVDDKGLCIELNRLAHENTNKQLHNPNLNGLTFYVPEPERTTMKVNGKEITDIKRNPPDYTGCLSISLPWSLLEFPEI